MSDFAIIGTGMAAFGASNYLKNVGIVPTLYDKRPYLGGHTASHVVNDEWVFDEGPHISFTKNERIRDFLAECVEDNFNEISARVNNYWMGNWINHPVQTNLYGLDPALVTKIILEMSSLRENSTEVVPKNYLEWLYSQFGETFSNAFPVKYTKKYHTTDARNLGVEWIGSRIYQPSLAEVVFGALAHDTPNNHYITKFRYPKKGGFSSYIQPIASSGNIRLNHEVVRIDHNSRYLYFKNGLRASYTKLISSMPLPEIVAALDDVPNNVYEASAALACSRLLTVTIGIDRPNVHDAHWTYFYDEDIIFSRLSTPHLQSNNNVPVGSSLLQAECYFSNKYQPLNISPETCISHVLKDLKRCGILDDQETPSFTHVLHTEYANIIFDLDSATATKIIHDYLDKIGIYYCGRYGDWAYHWTDQAFLSGEMAAEKSMLA